MKINYNKDFNCKIRGGDHCEKNITYFVSNIISSGYMLG